jgi:hypothetical protein
MYLPITQWLDQNPILFPCRRNRRRNHVAPPSLHRQMLKLSLLLLLLTMLLLTTRTPKHGFSPTAAGRTPLKK